MNDTQKESRDLMYSIQDLKNTKLKSAIMNSNQIDNELHKHYHTRIENLSDKFYKFQKLTKNLYETNLKIKLQDLFDSLKELIISINNKDPLLKIENIDYSINDKINSIYEIFKNDIPQNSNLEDKDTLRALIQDIKLHIPNFDPKDDIINNFYNLNNFQQKNIYTELAKLRNKLTKNEYSSSEFDKITEPLNEILTQISNFDEINRMYDEFKEGMKTFNMAKTETQNDKLLEGFGDAAENYSKKIFYLEIVTYILFTALISVVSHKYYLYLYNKLDIINLNGFIIFGSLIFAISGLLTFVIKERNRHLDLQNLYQKRHVELKALPKYMSELTLEQRRELTLDLAYTYFNGSPNAIESKTNENKISEINNHIDELKKLITNIKEINK